MLNIYDDVSSKSWLTILILVIFFAVIVGIVILIKKFSPHFKNEEKPKSEEEIAKEEVERLTVEINNELPDGEPEKVSLKDVDQEGSKEKTLKHSEQKPSEEEATEYYMRNVLGIEEMPEVNITDSDIDEDDEYASARKVEKQIELDKFTKEFEQGMEEIMKNTDHSSEQKPTAYNPNKKKEDKK